MKVLVIGGGGREHALAWALARSPRVTEVLVAPGNAGVEGFARRIRVPQEVSALLELAQREEVDLTVVGPEQPLVDGIGDAFAAAGLALVGPSRAAAALEGSKAHAKAFMARHQIPTARYGSFREERAARAFLDDVATDWAGIVVKDSRLAAGKGVTVAASPAEAQRAVERLFAAGDAEVVIEERLDGQEVSLLLFAAGEAYRPMLLAQDYKQAFDGDRGPMTGGMGAVAPAELLSAEEFATVRRKIVEPTLAGLMAAGTPYQGVLFIGLMLTADGPRVLEFNVRFGDPETQVVLPLLACDLLEVFEAIVAGRLEDVELRWHEGAAACVVLAAPGYPGRYPRGLPIGLPASLPDDVLLFHAGTEHAGTEHAGTERQQGGLRSAGGRVLDVVGLGADPAEAVAAAYRAVSKIDFPGAHYRRDIGARLLQTEQETS